MAMMMNDRGPAMRKLDHHVLVTTKGAIREVNALARDLLGIARKKLGANLPMPLITFELYSYQTAGSASLQRNKINLNPFALALFGEQFVKNLVAHELAHLIAWQLYGDGIKAHGPEWRHVMTVLGFADATGPYANAGNRYRAVCQRQHPAARPGHRKPP